VARTALLLRTDMRILKDDKMSPLFQEVIVASLVAQFPKTGYQIKDMDIIFPLIPHECVCESISCKPAKLSTFLQTSNMLKN